MSRSRHHFNFKGPGYEYWSGRPGTQKAQGTIGRWAKGITHRAERRQWKRECDPEAWADILYVCYEPPDWMPR